MSMGRKALLLGLGLQGQGAMYDLLKYGNLDEIRIFDNRADLTKKICIFETGKTKIVPIRGDVSERALLEDAMRGVDVVICLLPRYFALPMAEMSVEMGANYACASYMGNLDSDPEAVARQKKRMVKLRDKAKKKGLTILTQCGLDPGLDLLLAGEAVRNFDSVEKFISYGAGFPEPDVANNPLRYKFTWTIEGVMRSYFRPARIIRDGKIVDIPANEIFYDNNTHKLLVDELGEVLECFPNGDSVSLAEELGILGQVSSMGRYVCRWQGHCAFWSVIANCGFLKDDTVQIQDVAVSRVAFLAAVLSSEPQFFYKDGERDLTLTRVDITGQSNGQKIRKIYQIIDKKDLDTGFTSMTRTVGFVVSLGAIMALNGVLEKGVISPVEMPFKKTAGELERRNIVICCDKEKSII